MKLWIVVDNDRWGRSLNLVRAETREQAIALVRPPFFKDGRARTLNPDRIDVEEIPDGTEAAILWCEDESPDTPPEKD